MHAHDKHFGYGKMISSSRQQGDNPATLNPVGTADPNSYTVGGAMDTGDSENWGFNKEEDADL